MRIDCSDVNECLDNNGGDHHGDGLHIPAVAVHDDHDLYRNHDRDGRVANAGRRGLSLRLSNADRRGVSVRQPDARHDRIDLGRSTAHACRWKLGINAADADQLGGFDAAGAALGVNAADAG